MEQTKRGLDLQAIQMIFELDLSGSAFLELASAFRAQLKGQMLKLKSLSGAHHEDSFKCVEEVLKESLSVDLLLAAEISRILAKAS